MAWKAHFLSNNPETLENWIPFRDVQMLLLSIFEIPYEERLAKNVQKRYVQVIPRSTPRQTKLIDQSLHMFEHRIGYSNWAYATDERQEGQYLGFSPYYT